MPTFYFIATALLAAVALGPFRGVAFAQPKGVTLNAMGPLEVGSIYDPDSPAHAPAWARFEQDLRQVKAAGIEAITIDVWWGAVARAPDPAAFDWRYYDKISQALLRVGLKWVPILSFHTCGGNVGDNCNIPIPAWIWTEFSAPGDADALGYTSEFGNKSRETVSVWATQRVLPAYQTFMEAFQARYGSLRHHISEINISLGPAGELRYPSYNAHDGAQAGYPTRGSLQAYSSLARESFRGFVQKRYSTLNQVNLSWNAALSSWDAVGPPMDTHTTFFSGQQHLSPYGRDFFEWYQASLIQHGTLLMGLASQVFHAASASFRGVDLGAKIAGIHWRVGSDRLAELAAGLISTHTHAQWGRPDLGSGYRSLVSAWKPEFVLHFTCLEKGNGEGGPGVASRAEDLVFWIAHEAQRQGLRIKGENALEGALGDPFAWNRIQNALTWAPYEGMTFLRLGGLVATPGALENVHALKRLFEP